MSYAHLPLHQRVLIEFLRAFEAMGLITLELTEVNDGKQAMTVEIENPRGTVIQTFKID